jgi:hypothetical protein
MAKAKTAVKKPAAKAKAKGKATPKAKSTTAAKGKAKPATKAKVKKAKKPAIDWVAELRSGQPGVKKWNKLSWSERMKVKFDGADLSGADLRGVKFSYVDLSGVDLTGANLEGAFLGTTRFDERTKWPTEIKLADAMVWKGKGPDPRKVATPEERALPKPADFGGFLARLKQVTDPAKLDKATKMLKAERFKLFAKVEPDHVIGVVKSQSVSDLVYSCRLAKDGQYACCTQNLNICGGLKGSPCKHLLVLIVGLAKAGELDAGTAHEWTQNSRGRKPELDKDAMTATFLQYKGAEAGQIDWRPTETIPEDFYAM